MIGVGEIIIILIILVIVFFYGGKKLEELARGLGKFTGEFRKGKMEAAEELRKIEEEKEEICNSKSAQEKEEK